MNKGIKISLLCLIFILAISMNVVHAGQYDNKVAYWCKYEDTERTTIAVLEVNPYFWPTNWNWHSQDSYVDYKSGKGTYLTNVYEAGWLEKENSKLKSGKRIFVTHWEHSGISKKLSADHPCPYYAIYDTEGMIWKREFAFGESWNAIRNYGPEVDRDEGNVYLKLSIIEDVTAVDNGGDKKITSYNLDTGETSIVYIDNLGNEYEIVNGAKVYHGAINYGNNNYLEFRFCERPGVLKVMHIIGMFKDILKILVPVLLIIFAIIDTEKNAVSGNDKDIKNSMNMALKRLIAGIIIFFIPTIVDFVLTRISLYNQGNYSDTEGGGFAKCAYCFASPRKENCEDRATIKDYEKN